jgi:hypothetical protein
MSHYVAIIPLHSREPAHALAGLGMAHGPGGGRNALYGHF